MIGGAPPGGRSGPTPVRVPGPHVNRSPGAPEWGVVVPSVGVEPTASRIPIGCYFHLSFDGVVPDVGIEPTTARLRIGCSTRLSLTGLNWSRRRGSNPPISAWHAERPPLASRLHGCRRRIRTAVEPGMGRSPRLSAILQYGTRIGWTRWESNPPHSACRAVSPPWYMLAHTSAFSPYSSAGRGNPRTSECARGKRTQIGNPGASARGRVEMRPRLELGCPGLQPRPRPAVRITSGRGDWTRTCNRRAQNALPCHWATPHQGELVDALGIEPSAPGPGGPGARGASPPHDERSRSSRAPAARRLHGVDRGRTREAWTPPPIHGATPTPRHDLAGMVGLEPPAAVPLRGTAASGPGFPNGPSQRSGPALTAFAQSGTRSSPTGHGGPTSTTPRAKGAGLREGVSGGHGRTRTHDLRINNPTLRHFSFMPSRRWTPCRDSNSVGHGWEPWCAGPSQGDAAHSRAQVGSRARSRTGFSVGTGE